MKGNIKFIIYSALLPIAFFSLGSSSNVSLKELADKRGIIIGTCIMPEYLNDNMYVKTLLDNFNAITPENHMKWELIHPEKNRYNWAGADRLVEFAEKNKLKVRGHTLVWHNQNPPWLNQIRSKEEALNVLREHIYAVAGRYKGKIYAWDVVNEVFDDYGGYRGSIWYFLCGPEYIDRAFQWTKEADPSAKLFINDYNIETINRKSDAVYNYCKDAIKRRVPIDGVGFQFHIQGDREPNYDSIRKNIKRFVDLGLEVHITELDVRLPSTKPSKEELELQGRIYGKLIELILEFEKTRVFTVWGFTDRYSWIPGFFKGWGSATMFDENYQPKPAFYNILEVLQRKN